MKGRRNKGVLVKLTESEYEGLIRLCERDVLQKSQVLRRLLVREIRASIAE